jgi:hypothetical protein
MIDQSLLASARLSARNWPTGDLRKQAAEIRKEAAQYAGLIKEARLALLGVPGAKDLDLELAIPVLMKLAQTKPAPADQPRLGLNPTIQPTPVQPGLMESNRTDIGAGALASLLGLVFGGVAGGFRGALAGGLVTALLGFLASKTGALPKSWTDWIDKTFTSMGWDPKKGREELNAAAQNAWERREAAIPEAKKRADAFLAGQPQREVDAINAGKDIAPVTPEGRAALEARKSSGIPPEGSTRASPPPVAPEAPAVAGAAGPAPAPVAPATPVPAPADLMSEADNAAVEQQIAAAEQRDAAAALDPQTLASIQIPPPPTNPLLTPEEHQRMQTDLASAPSEQAGVRTRGEAGAQAAAAPAEAAPAALAGLVPPPSASPGAEERPIRGRFVKVDQAEELRNRPMPPDIKGPIPLPASYKEPTSASVAAAKPAEPAEPWWMKARRGAHPLYPKSDKADRAVATAVAPTQKAKDENAPPPPQTTAKAGLVPSGLGDSGLGEWLKKNIIEGAPAQPNTRGDWNTADSVTRR